MIHPSFRLAEGELPGALTPVYPTVAGLPQNYLRKAVLSGLFRADLRETLPEEVLGKSLPQPCGACAIRCGSCTTRRPTCRWPRWKTAATRPGSA
jgi:RecG-like helicase